MENEQAAAAVTAPDPTDFNAYESAREKGWSPDEQSTEQPADTAAAEATTESTSAPTDGQPADQANAQPDAEAGKPANADDGHAPKWFRRELKRIRNESKQEIEQLRQQMAARATAQPNATAPAAAQPVRNSNVDELKRMVSEIVDTDLPDYDTKLAVIADRVADKKIAEFRKSVEAQLETEQRQARERAAAVVQQQQDQVWADKVTRGRQAHPDFDEVVFDQDTVPADIGNFVIRELDNSADVAYHLATNPAEVERIAVLPPAQKAKELLKLDLRFAGNGNGPSRPAESKPINGSTPKPKPISPNGSGGVSNIRDINDPAVQRDFRAWERLREAQLDRR